MFVRRRHLLLLGLLAILMSTLIVACQGNLEQNVASPSSATAPANCRIVEHDAGETEICGQPQTIAVLSPRVLDVMLALDVQPAAYATSAHADGTGLSLRRFDNPSQQIPHLGDRITTQPINLGHRNTPSLERLIEVNPDLIVTETWLENDQFSDIAPTLLLTNRIGRNGWSRRLQIIAQAVGKEEQAEQVIAHYDQRLAEVRTQLAPVLATYPRILPVTTLGSNFELASYESDIAALLEELGFQLVLLEGLPRETPDSPRAPQISVEALTQLDPDIIIVPSFIADNVYNPEAIVKQAWDANPLLQNMRAVQAGHIHFVNGKLWGGNIGGPIAFGLMLDQLPELLLPFVEEK